MKKIFLTLFSIIVISFCSYGQVGFSLAPFSSTIGLKTSQQWRFGGEFRMTYSLVGANGYAKTYSFSPELQGFFRIVNKDNVKLYTGLGVVLRSSYQKDTVSNINKGVSYSQTGIYIPLGVEVFPLEKTPALSFTAELSPIWYVQSGSYSSSIRTFFAVNYYLGRKKD